MFSTFTGNSRRPRNVNLSGQAGNPFANTSWTPSTVSNASKTVSDAQAEREKRQADRQRLKAAGSIQRTWRGHKARKTTHEAHRAAFDELYATSSQTNTSQRLPRAFKLLLSFFSGKNRDDLQRLALYVRDTQFVDLQDIAPNNVHPSRIRRLVRILVTALDKYGTHGELSIESQMLLRLVTRIASAAPETILPSIDSYFSMLAKICQTQEISDGWTDLLKSALSAPFVSGTSNAEAIYHAYAFSFLSARRLHFFETHVQTLSESVAAPALASAILDGLPSVSDERASRDDTLWLLSHYIDLGRVALHSSQRYLETLFALLATLAPEISVRIDIKLPESDDAPEGTLLQSLDPYISSRLLSLVETTGISMLLQDFSVTIAEPSQNGQDVSLLAGYFLTLLRCFPGRGDDIRMRLFLAQIPAASGDIPIVKYLWQIMRRTTIFGKMSTTQESHVHVLRRHFTATNGVARSEEEQDWPIILLFLDLYVFVLRLSDDEDFFSGIFPQLEESKTQTSRLRSCSLSLDDVEHLTRFLKNTAFTLHYKAQDLSRALESTLEPATDARTGGAFTSFALQSGLPAGHRESMKPLPRAAARLQLDSLRNIVTLAMKMLYERDSRKQFLPAGHWLMTAQLVHEDFINAVIAEEERKNQEDEEASEDGEDSDDDQYGDGSGVYSTEAGQRLSRHVRFERLKAQQIRTQRERRLAELGPKLEILKHMPFVVPFDTRVQIFRQFIMLDRLRRDGGRPFGGDGAFAHAFARHHAKIRRSQLFEDAYQQFYQLGDGLKDPIQISFVDQFGTPEAGIDGGGVTKEFLISVTSEAFGDEGKGMFASNQQNLLYPDPTAIDVVRESMLESGMDESDPELKNHVSSLLKRFEFLGRIVGKCLYEGILVDLAFAGFFLLKWTSTGPNDVNSYKGSVNDLRDLDEDLYNGLLGLKNYSGDVSELGMDFTIEDQVSQPGEPVKTITRKLIANGDKIQVTNDNRLLYISYVARHRLVVQPALQTAAFLRGLRAIIRPSWLSMFNQSELQRLVGGDSREIDIEDLRRNTVYSGLYEIGDDGEEHDTIKIFWKVVHEFEDAERRTLLKYVSSTPRAPLLGFAQLRPKFSIRDGGTDEERLPSTSTCVNLLKLPRYTSEETLREKLLYAIRAGAGFDLS